MPLLTIRLFGELSAVDHRGNALSIGHRKTQALVVYLALRGERSSMSEAGALLFGAGDEDGIQGLVRDLRYALRFLPSVLVTDGDQSIRFDEESVSIDTHRFDRLVTGGSINNVREAAELYGGNLLDGFTAGVTEFDEWLAEQRLFYWRSALTTFGRLLAAQIKAGWWENAVETAGRLLSLDPSQEVVHRALMRLQLEQGRPDAALRRYQECSDILRREFKREPSAETERVREEIIAALDRSPAPREATRNPIDRPVLVLLVEDDIVSAALVEEYLTEAGYGVISVGDGADALIEIGRRQFDLLLLDINIPTLSGLRLFEIMIQKGIETPAVFITGIAGPEVEARSLEIGAADFLRKPIRKEVLLPRIRAILQRRERAAAEGGRGE